MLSLYNVYVTSWCNSKVWKRNFVVGLSLLYSCNEVQRVRRYWLDYLSICLFDYRVCITPSRATELIFNQVFIR